MVTGKINPAFKPISKKLFISIVISFLVLLISIGIVVIPELVARNPSLFETSVFLVLTFACIASALGISKAIPKNSLSWEEWRRPIVVAKVIGSVLLTGLAVPLSFIAYLGTPPAPKVPESPAAILSLIQGRWGEEPDCALVWDIRLIEVAGKRALEAELVVRPEGYDPYTYVGEVGPPEGLSLTTSGLEPAKARGGTTVFTVNPATGRLKWDNRTKAGDIEEYQRCPAD